MYSRCRPTGSGSSRSVGSLAISRSTSQTASASGGIRWRIRRRICVRVVTPGALFSYRRGNIELGARCCTCEAYRRRIVPSEYSDYREYVLDPAIADDCRSAGYARGQLPNGAPVVLNKDVCEGIWFRCATTGPRASCRASASTARCRRPATVLAEPWDMAKAPGGSIVIKSAKSKRSKLQLEALALAAVNHLAVSVTVRRVSPPDRNWNWELASIEPAPSGHGQARARRSVLPIQMTYDLEED